MFNKCNKNKTKNILWFYNAQDEVIKWCVGSCHYNSFSLGYRLTIALAADKYI